MKTSVSFAYCVAIAMMVFAPNCGAQQPYVNGAIGAGGQISQPANGIATGMAAYQAPFPGRIWFGTNIADQAVGFNGIYLSLGLKTRLFEDRLDGRWLTEFRIHQSLEHDDKVFAPWDQGGGFFSNIGLERVFSIDAANADITVGAWVDYDDATNHQFGHANWQVGINASIKSPNWDLIGNGYFPTNRDGYTQGDPNGIVPFYQNQIVLVPGIDSALTGFDTTFRVRPRAFSHLNGSIDVGAYGYSSNIIEFFAGGRARLNAQLWNSWIVSGELSYDDRFDLTGGVNLSYVWGLNARGSEYAGIGRDLERTVRNDHIVRYNQEVVYAIDPDNGRPYTVWHVKNDTLDPLALQNGTFENPYATLAQAEASSQVDDIIFVDEGDGTTTGYDRGIQLKERQMLLGDGVRHRIAIDNGAAWGPFYELIHNLDNNRPAITGNSPSNLGDAVTLDSQNVVRGFLIDGNQSTDGMRHGIYGDVLLAGHKIDSATIEDNVINGALLDGVKIWGAEGSLEFRRNVIGEFSVGPGPDRPNGGSGIYIRDFIDPLQGELIVQNNNLVGNGDGVLGGHGLSVQSYQLRQRDHSVPEYLQKVGVLIEDNVVANNLRDGIRLSENLFDMNDGFLLPNYFTSRGAITNRTTDIDIVANQVTSNGANGINVFNELENSGVGILGGGRLRILETTSTGNAGAGVRVENWTNQTLDGNGQPTVDQTLISSRTDGPSSVISGNGRGIEVLLGNANVPVPGWNQNLVISDASVNDNNGAGIRATVDGVGLVMNTSIVDNLAITGNGTNGITVASLGGSTHRAIIENSAAAVGPTLLDLGGNGGSAIDILAANDLNGNQSYVDALIRNVSAVGSGNHGINISSSDAAHVKVFAENILAAGNAAHGMNVDVRAKDEPPQFPSVVNEIIVKDSIMDVNGGNGLTLRTYGGKTDLLVTGSTFNGNLGTLARTPPPIWGTPIVRTGFGIDVTATTQAGIIVPSEENFTRVQIYGSQMNTNARSGLTMESRQQANLYATVDSNVMNGNGFTEFIFDPWPFAPRTYVKLNDRGVDIAAYDRSRFTLDMSNNLITGNAEEGLSMHVDSTTFPAANAAQLHALLENNAITGNDQWADGDIPKIANERDIVFVNGSAAGGSNGLFNLAMSNNSIAINPAVTDVQAFFNFGAPNRFRIGLDGVTNGFADSDITDDIIVGNGFEFPTPYESVVGPELEATYLQFLAEGFPLMPPP
ncbi:MAG: hypothetical protein MK108_04785 [Mariniblastus sp.]|nr:hypothetical protein [Mariniblastus sp.]